MINERKNFRKNSRKLNELRQFDKKIKQKRLSRPKLRKGRLKRLKKCPDTLKKPFSLSVEMASPPISPPYSNFSDQDISMFKNNFISNNQNNDITLFSVDEQFSNQNLENFLLSFDLEKNQQYVFKSSSLNKLHKSIEDVNESLLNSSKEISPVPCLDSPLSSLSDMVKISENLLQNDIQRPDEAFKKKKEVNDS